ncbi:MAG: hypothetical protein CL862_13630 [Cyanobium sp. NAT70]|nr:hypothetical protein [Cyanobium sp. NAT70]
MSFDLLDPYRRFGSHSPKPFMPFNRCVSWGGPADLLRSSWILLVTLAFGGTGRYKCIDYFAWLR